MTEKDKIHITEYCPKCERITTHEPVTDAVFDWAIMCLVCRTIWESDKPIEDEDES